jgi:hypothetical protein
MKISGFTMVRNATKLYYPIREAIESILPICDEFVVALGNCDPDDATEQEILRIGSDKVRIIRTTWDLERFPRGGPRPADRPRHAGLHRRLALLSPER